MINLLDETLEIIKENGKTTEEIKFVSANWYIYENKERTYYERYMTWEDFASQANKIYDDGYGRIAVKDALQIVGANWWLERHEYDGSEWWEFKSLPTQPKEYKKFSPFKYEEDEQ